jgi:2-hydroxy-3-oxopropionate reductase
MRRLGLVARALGVDLLDTPMSGGVDGARAGTLAVFAGGEPEALARARPVLAVFARSIVHLGPIGAGSVGKACNQLIVGSTILAVAEALTLARAAGLDPALVRDAMAGGYAASRVLEVHGRRMLDDDFAPGARIDLHAKDAAIVRELADERGVELDGFAVTAAALQAAIDAGDGDLDHAALIRQVVRR